MKLNKFFFGLLMTPAVIIDDSGRTDGRMQRL